MTRIELLDDDPNGLAGMLGGLIEANLKAHPERARLLTPPGVVGIVATDADVAVTMRLAPGRVSLRGGLVGSPHLVIRTDSATLTDLTSAPLRLGFPDVVTSEGRIALGKLRTGDLRVAGLLRHPGLLSRLNRLLSVA